MQLPESLLEDIVALHRFINRLFRIMEIAQFIHHGTAFRIIRTELILLGNRLALAGRLVCVWLSAGKKPVFKLALHMIEDLVLLVGALHRVLAHDAVNISSNVPLAVGHLLPCASKTISSVCGSCLKIAIRTVSVHMLLPVKIERTLRVAQVIDQPGVYRVCNILACVIAFVTEEAKCQTGDISVLISQLHILHPGISDQRHHIVIVTVKLLPVKDGTALIGIVIRGTCEKRSVPGVFQNLLVLHVVHAAVASSPCGIEQSHCCIHLLLGALGNVRVVHEIRVCRLVLRISWSCLRCTVHLHESIRQILARCRRNQLVLLVRSQTDIHGDRGAVGILANHEITTAVMGKMMQDTAHLHEVARLAGLESADHHDIFQPGAEGNILVTGHVVCNHHGSSLNTETCGSSTKLLCAMKQPLSGTLLQAGNSEPGNPGRHHRTRYAEHGAGNRTVSCTFQTSLADSLQGSIIAGRSLAQCGSNARISCKIQRTCCRSGAQSRHDLLCRSHVGNLESHLLCGKSLRCLHHAGLHQSVCQNPGSCIHGSTCTCTDYGERTGVSSHIDGSGSESRTDARAVGSIPVTGNLLDLRITISDGDTFLQSPSGISRHDRWSHHHADNGVAEILGDIVKRTVRHDFLLAAHRKSLLGIVHDLRSHVPVNIFLHTHVEFPCTLGNMALHSLLRIDLADFPAEIVHQDVLAVHLFLRLRITESLFLYRLGRIDAALPVKVLLILLTCQLLRLIHGRIYQTEKIITQNASGLPVISCEPAALNLIPGKCPCIVLSLLSGSGLSGLWSRKLLHRLAEVPGSRGYPASADRGSSLLLLTCSLFLCSLHTCARIAGLSLLHRVHLAVAHVHQPPVLHVVRTGSSSRSRLLGLLLP